MASIWESIKRRAARVYDYSRLVDTRFKDNSGNNENAAHIVCDIDKTYLETQFETFYQIARIAFESASRKRGVRGASDVLLAARWSHCDTNASAPTLTPKPLHFVSSSPPQLRAVLEEKLFLDGIDWTSDTFKNQAYNLLKGRVDLLKHHVAYKSAAVLQLISNAQPGASFTLIGDNAEWDAYVYLGIQLFVSERLNADGYRRYLEGAGVDIITAQSIAQTFANNNATVTGILIRNAPNYHFIPQPKLTDGVQLFDHYFQAAAALLAWDVIHPRVLWQLVRAFHNRHGITRSELLSCIHLLADSSRQELRDTVNHVAERLGKIDMTGEAASTFALSLKPAAPELDQETILTLAQSWVEKLRHARQMHSEADA